MTLVALFATVFTFSSCGDNSSDPPQKKDTPTTELKEFYQFNDKRVEAADFTQRTVKITEFEHQLRIQWNRNNFMDIPASDIIINIDTLAEGDYTPYWTGLYEYKYLGVGTNGYISGTGKFNPIDGEPFGHCKLYQKDGVWVVDIKDIPVVDNTDDTWTGKVSALLFWKE